LQVVLALDACGGLADLLHGRQQQADEDGDDGDHHQQLNQREGAAAPTTGLFEGARHQSVLLHLPESLAGSWGLCGVSQIFTVPSLLAEAMCLPSGLNVTLRTTFKWPRNVCMSPVTDSHTLTVASVPPHASRRPSGLKATLRIPPVGSVRLDRSFQL